MTGLYFTLASERLCGLDGGKPRIEPNRGGQDIAHERPAPSARRHLALCVTHCTCAFFSAPESNRKHRVADYDLWKGEELHASNLEIAVEKDGYGRLLATPNTTADDHVECVLTTDGEQTKRLHVLSRFLGGRGYLQSQDWLPHSGTSEPNSVLSTPCRRSVCRYRTLECRPKSRP